jgi:hypothetical protein
LRESNTIIEIKGYVGDKEKLLAKIDLAKEKGFEIKILYREDLKECFKYVRNTYKTTNFANLYDSGIIKIPCKQCQKEFVQRDKSIFCSRDCSGRWVLNFSKNRKSTPA